LLKIDDTQVNRARELPLTLTPADETQALRDVRATALLNDGMVLHGLGITPDRDTVRYVPLTDAGSEVTLEYYGKVSSSAGPPLPTSLKQDGCVLWLIQHSNQEAREMVLPNSRWGARYSLRFYRFVRGEENLIRSDRKIAETWADFQAGRDPVMDWVLRTISDAKNEVEGSYCE
jgi:hypothetical protein